MRHERTTSDANLLSALQDGVLVLTLDRQQARNAMTVSMMEALAGELRFAASSAEVAAVLLQGAGRAFCAGGDVKDMNGAQPDDAQIRHQRRVQRETAGALAEMPKPTLAVINGPAAGAGLSLALACDLRIMSDTAFLVTSFAQVALSGDFGASYFLTHLVGSARAKELMFLSERIPAARALEMGLTNWTCAPEELTQKGLEIAARLAVGPTSALGYMKENINRAYRSDLGECLDVEATHHIHCSVTADHREGVAAFVEKRSPRFGQA